jgi:hypothetical protein
MLAGGVITSAIPRFGLGPWPRYPSRVHRGALVEEHEGPVGQVGPGQPMHAAAMAAAEDALAVQLPVDLLCRGHLDAETVGPGGAVGVVGLAPALRAGPVAGGERDRLVVEEEEGEPMWLPLLAPAATKLEGTGDPEVAGMEADDLGAAVEDAAIAGPGAAQREGLDLAQRRDAVARGGHVRTVKPRRH